MRIAITGGVAEGKSTVCQALSDAGYATISADAVARAVFLEPDVQRSLAAIIGLNGPEVTPAEVRAAITQDPKIRSAVNQLMHPRVRSQMDASPAPFHEVPLLIEACLHSRYDKVWVVTCGPEEQLARLALRLGSQEAAIALIQTQLPTCLKLAFADQVIDTRFSASEVSHRALELARACLAS